MDKKIPLLEIPFPTASNINKRNSGLNSKELAKISNQTINGLAIVKEIENKGRI